MVATLVHRLYTKRGSTKGKKKNKIPQIEAQNNGEIKRESEPNLGMTLS
jgi:hypothetical protein